ncbi:MAG: hypothetical protein ACOY9J_03400 [Pseudomonadota bacterium]
MGNAFDSTNYPTTEPAELVIGDRWAWKRSDLSSDYPLDSYSLSYAISKQGTTSTIVTLTATESGSDYLIEVASATTATYTAGTYNWQAYITRSSDSARHSIGHGTFRVLSNLSASTADPRTHVKKTLDAIEAVIEGRASIDQMGYTIQGRTLQKTPIPDLLLLRDKYKTEYARELDAERLAQGRAPRNRLLTRFR